MPCMNRHFCMEWRTLAGCTGVLTSRESKHTYLGRPQIISEKKIINFDALPDSKHHIDRAHRPHSLLSDSSCLSPRLTTMIRTSQIIYYQLSGLSNQPGKHTCHFDSGQLHRIPSTAFSKGGKNFQKSLKIFLYPPFVECPEASRKKFSKLFI